MDVLVVYESMFGNTARVAEAIARGLRHDDTVVTLRNVDDVADEDIAAYDLLVVGGPTHAHGMSRAGTRRMAFDDRANDYVDPTIGDGLRGWLEELGEMTGKHAAAFDTRFERSPLLVGEASKGIARRLQHLRFDVIERKSFFVTTENELLPGELDKAEHWGRRLAGMLAPAAR
jgi:Flavodoxin